MRDSEPPRAVEDCHQHERITPTERPSDAGRVSCHVPLRRRDVEYSVVAGVDTALHSSTLPINDGSLPATNLTLHERYEYVT